jgi:hypothetical protein
MYASIYLGPETSEISSSPLSAASSPSSLATVEWDPASSIAVNVGGIFRFTIYYFFMKGSAATGRLRDDCVPDGKMMLIDAGLPQAGLHIV